MKRLDGNYKNTMVTNSIMYRIKKELVNNIILKISNCNFVFSDGNTILFDKWIEGLNINELSNLKLYGDCFGYEKLSILINSVINNYAEEI